MQAVVCAQEKVIIYLGRQSAVGQPVFVSLRQLRRRENVRTVKRERASQAERGRSAGAEARRLEVCLGESM